MANDKLKIAKPEKIPAWLYVVACPECGHRKPIGYYTSYGKKYTVRAFRCPVCHEKFRIPPIPNSHDHVKYKVVGIETRGNNA